MSVAENAAAEPGGRQGPGLFVAVCGPSGAGKDTLIATARRLSEGDSGLVFARRVVTRPASIHEDHDSVTVVAFGRAVEAGRFALCWEAHGLRYGVPVTVDADIGAGRAVICNVSRGGVPALRARYANTLIVLVTAPPDVLAARLSERARASDGGAAGRLARNAEVDGVAVPDVTIENIGTPEQGARRLLAAIAERAAVRCA